MNSYSFQVPASTSNLGAGFDALSLALNLYLRLTIEPALDFSIQAVGVGADSIPTTSENLILRVARHAADQRSRRLPCFQMKISNEIPLARGLGSSAAAIIAGITCYELMTDDPLTEAQIFQYAFAFEPHPDNLAAALHGSLVSAATAPSGSALVARLEVAAGVVPLVVVPDFELSTEKARSVLPAQYSRADTVHNIQRAALTVAALTTGRWSVLREAMQDRIHQPYRASLIPGLSQVLAIQAPGLAGISLSGAGPTVFALAEPGLAASVGAKIVQTFAEHGVRSTSREMKIDREGRVRTQR